MNPDTVLLEARDIGRRHPNGRDWLLEDVSLEVRRGQRLAVAGPSGSGKTLLLRALALLDPLDRGEIRWRGRAVRADRVPSFRRQAVYLHQRPAFGEQTVEAAFRRPFSLGVHRDRRFDRDRAVRRLETLGRDRSFLEKQICDLSGGESQITALVRALELDPALLLLDEPTAALDAETAQAVERMLDRWATDSDRARALVWVSHDTQQAARVAQRVLCVQSGRLVGEDQA